VRIPALLTPTTELGTFSRVACGYFDVSLYRRALCEGASPRYQVRASGRREYPRKRLKEDDDTATINRAAG
jgi:hypothetical protein